MAGWCDKDSKQTSSGRSAGGDLRAERDVLAVLSNCPQMHNACNAYHLTPIRAIIWRLASRENPGEENDSDLTDLSSDRERAKAGSALQPCRRGRRLAVRD